MDEAVRARQRWTFTVQTPLGETHSTYAITDVALIYESDDPLAGDGAAVRWSTIREGSTAAMEGMGGGGGPDLPTWVPAQMEWLVLTRIDEVESSFMRRLPPPGADREALLAAVRERLGTRWLGEGLPLKEAQQRMGTHSQEWSGLKVAGIVVAVLGMLVLAILLLALLLTPFVLVPAGLVAGGWLLRRGLRMLRDGKAAAGMAVAQVGRARIGLVHIEAPAEAATPTRAAITGRACAWWDVAVWVWYESDSEDSGGWRRVASRHGGSAESIDIGDETGSATVWLNGAELLLELRSWESDTGDKDDKDALPPRGVALLDTLGFPWRGGQRLRVTEECVEVGATLYVIGTLDLRRNVPESQAPGWLERTVDAIRTGAWRRNVVAAAPAPMRVVLAVFIGFIDMFTGIGAARMRPRTSRDGPPPALSPNARMVWKGHGDRPFIVSDRPERGALAALRKRAWITGGIGAAILCFVLYELVS
ncbi:hypothetical protein [Variovorax sp. dw_308]|uniref:hypothetical protein n=1 Tax=Variovorax sp. dw_308 TaxID=2721546 RepID=UPI001C47237B|nr:hypothetical protein [Variovorax sp. dw_308]